MNFLTPQIQEIITYLMLVAVLVVIVCRVAKKHRRDACANADGKNDSACSGCDSNSCPLKRDK